jgi:hypothetical protein
VGCSARASIFGPDVPAALPNQARLIKVHGYQLASLTNRDHPESMSANPRDAPPETS